MWSASSWSAAWLALACAAPVLALDPTSLPSQYVLRRWGAEAIHGGTVHAIRQTRDGYLWIGTNAGLVRHDGSRFQLFNPQNAPALEDGGVSTLTEAPNGDLFIGTTSGRVVRYHEGLFERTSIPGGSGRVTAVCADRAGVVWSSTIAHKVSQWKNGVLIAGDEYVAAPSGVLSAFATQAAGVIVEDPSDGVWIGTPLHGVIHVKSKDVTAYPLPAEVRALAFDHEGRLWVGTANGLLRRLEDGSFQRVDGDGGLTSTNITALLEDRDHNLWVGTAGGGLNRLTAGHWSHIDRSIDSLSDDDVRVVIEDHEGNIWVGTADGLNRLSDGTFVTYGRAEGVTDIVSAVAPGRHGAVWAGTDAGRLLRLSGGTLESFATPTLARGRNKVIALREMSDGAVWLTVENRSLFRFSDGRFTEWPPSTTRTARGQSGVPGEPVGNAETFFEGENGEPLFFVSRLGLAHMDLPSGVFTALWPDRPDSGDCLFPRYPHHVFRDSEGSTWLADLCGLARRKNGTWKLFSASDGLPPGRVRWVTADADDRSALWVATSSGLAYLRNGVAHMIERKDGLPEGYLRVVLDDGHGALWVGSNGSVFRLQKREVLDFFAKRVQQLTPRVFDLSDGLRTTEIPLSNNPAFLAEDGRLWFATAKGLAVVNPARLPSNAAPPPVHIEEVAVDEKPYGVRSAIQAPPGQGDLMVRFSALSYSVPERVRFRYKLEGRDRRWIDAGDRRLAFYTSLRPGHYRFRVIACNNDGVWNEQGGAIDLDLAPHFYQTRWFLALGVLIGISGILTAHRARVRLLKAREKVLARRVEEAVAQVKVLRGLLPICASCKKIRDDKGYWNQIETYIRAHSDAAFSHSICPDCLVSLYPEYIGALPGEEETPHS